MIHQYIADLTGYALQTGLIDAADFTWAVNSLCQALDLDTWEERTPRERPLEETLAGILDWAEAQGRIDGGVTGRDLLDTKLMGVLTPRPSQVLAVFRDKYRQSPKTATDWYYKFSQDTDYIRRYRVCKDLKWKSKTEYGDLDITINLSKPEKDPKAIAAARNLKQSGYPACLLCRQNEGYAGRMNHAARQTHRIIPLKLAGENWYMQYSPYVYYNEHCIVFDEKHEPMKIERKTFERLLDFVTQFPHYTLGSNADIPIVGGSILTHNHFQGGHYEFPMARAPIEKELKLKKFPKVKAGIVKWPMSLIRLDAESAEELVDAADFILQTWRNYTDQAAFIFAQTDGEIHNTITPIARRRGDLFELDLVLRNNITTQEHPLGVFHPHANLHHIKKENIGLIEVMGLAVLPSRLKKELADLETAVKAGKNLRQNEVLAKHADWIDEIKGKYSELNQEALQKEVGIVFSKVLEDAGVFKRNDEGQKAFLRFAEKLNV